MKIAILLLLALLNAAHAADLNALKVLYIGDPGSARAQAFETFLRTHVSQIKISARDRFDPATAARFDVVLLDWPQSDLARQDRPNRSPLGARENWSKPTILLGSAGLNLAVAWKVRGGSG